MDLMKLFACGTDPRIFKKSYSGLSDDDQTLLNRVASRAWITLLLRYDIKIQPNILYVDGGYNAEYKISVEEIPSIEVYLLFSCLDTLAGSSYKHFSDWIDDQTIDRNLSIEEIKDLFRSYKDEHGVSKNLRELFNNLPNVGKAWLFKNLKIEKEKEYLSGDVIINDLEKFLKRLFIFYYNIRNSFTHQSESKAINIAKDIYDPEPKKGWTLGPRFVMDHHKPNQRWILKYRPGLDIATILRVILFSVVLQKLDIPVTEYQLSAHMSHLSRVNSFRAFLNEVRSNTYYLEALSKISEKDFGELKSRIFHNGFPCLNRMSTFDAITKFKKEYPFESGRYFMAREYFKHVVEINKKLIGFNRRYLVIENKDERWEKIDNFIADFIEDDRVKEIIDWPKRVEMRNLWFIIRDPCYT